MSLDQFTKFASDVSSALSPVSGIASAIGGIGSIFGSFGAAKRQEKRAQRMMDYQYKLQERAAANAYDRNLTMWNMQNEYNSPAAMMSRLVDAGLNPNLVYSELSSGKAESLPAYNAPSPGLANPVNTDDAQTLATASQLPVQASLAAATTAKTLTDQKLSHAQYLAQKIENQYKNQYWSANLRSAIATADLNEKQVTYLDGKIAEIDITNKKANQELDNLKKTAMLLDLEIDQKELDYTINVITQNAQVQKIISEAYISKTQAKYIVDQLLTDIRYKSLSADTLLYEAYNSTTFYNLVRNDPDSKALFEQLAKDGVEVDANNMTFSKFISQAMAKIGETHKDHLIRFYTKTTGDIMFFIQDVLPSITEAVKTFADMRGKGKKPNPGEKI